MGMHKLMFHVAPNILDYSFIFPLDYNFGGKFIIINDDDDKDVIMEVNKKLLAIAMAGILSVGANLAWADADSDDTSSSGSGHFFVGGNLAYLTQTNSGTGYAVDIDDSTGLPNGNTYEVGSDYHFSGGLNLGYLTPNNTDFEFLMFLSNHSDSDNTPNTDAEIGPTLIPGQWASSDDELADSASSTVSSNNQLFELRLGHWFQQDRWKLHPFVGLNLSHLSTDQSTSYVSDSSDNFNADIEEKTWITGFGPEVGFDGSYQLWDKLSLQSNVTFALLTGNLKSSYSAVDLDDDEDPVDVEASDDNNVFEYVNLELGPNYAFDFFGHNGSVGLFYRLSEFLGSNSSLSLPEDYQESFYSNTYEDFSFSGYELKVQIDI